MEATKQNGTSDAPTASSVRPDVVRITVINNSQIISGVVRTAVIVGFAAGALGICVRYVSPVFFRETLTTLDIGLIAVCVALLVLGQIFDRALRRCPICRSRITRKTEETRRCLECSTELYGYWDE